MRALRAGSTGGSVDEAPWAALCARRLSIASVMIENLGSLVTDSIARELEKAGDRAATTSQAQKKNYAEVLSRELAQRFADLLRPQFPGILPDPSGKGQESRARTSKGFKKLDVNYSTVELGLGLGVSIKTINFRDAASRRYTKNYTRADGELRAEASDYHERQPYAVMVAVVFLPADACDDAVTGVSSFGAAVQIFRSRAGRGSHEDAPMLFERVFIGLYEAEAAAFGRVGFFDVMSPPPRRGRPRTLMGFDDLLGEIIGTYDHRNAPPFAWADGTEEIPEPPDEDEEEVF
jgi:hypothetical protein